MTGKRDVLLISMPWQQLTTPSIQLGILQSLLEREGIRARSATLALHFMEHCLAATSALAGDQRIRVEDYDKVAQEHFSVGLGDWIFAVPPFRHTPTLDGPYLDYLRSARVPEGDIQKALAMRRLVPAFIERTAREIVRLRPRIVGFTSTFNQNVPSLVLAKTIKLRDPSIAVVFGGANCDGPMGSALHESCPWIDVVVRGEAEPVLPALVRDLLAGGAIRAQPGLCLREHDRSVAVQQASPRTSMNDVPVPNYDEYFAALAKTSFAAEVDGAIRLPYESARGCWWGVKSHCTFCGLNGTSMMFRSKEAERVIDELTALARRYRRLDFQVVDNILDLRYLRHLMPQLRDTGYNLRLFYETKSNLKRDEVRLLSHAGVGCIQPGIESLSSPILRLMRKGTTAFQNIRLLKWCAEYGVRTYWNVIFGFPGEPPGEYARMADLVPSLTHLEPPAGWSDLAIERFSPYHQRPAEYGLELLGPAPWYRHVYEADDHALNQLAYCFEYRHLDGRDPRVYAEPLRLAVWGWREHWTAGAQMLSYRRGPGFLVVTDERPNLERANYWFDEPEASLYLACEDGATAAEAWTRAGNAEIDEDDVNAFLSELVEQRLVYEEHGRYLALALPTVPRRAAADISSGHRESLQLPIAHDLRNASAHR